MTLLDAPVYDAARYRRHQVYLWSGVGLVLVLLIGGWLVSGMPVDWPWNWWTHFQGRSAANRFLSSVERNDLQKAYSVWIHDPNWQAHPDKTGTYSFSRFQQDWSSTSPDNEYGIIHSHKIIAARRSGNVLIMGIRINGLKSKALFLTYDPKDHTLGFSPLELYLGP